MSLQIVESVVKKYEEGSTKAIEDMTLDELEEVEDDADEAILLQYRYPSLIKYNVYNYIIYDIYTVANV